MKKTALTVLIILISFVSLVSVYGEKFRYSIGLCYMSPQTPADEALIRGIEEMCGDSRVEVVLCDAGNSLSILTGFAEECLSNRGIYGLIILCDDQQTVDLIVSRSNEEKVPVAVLGIPPSDMEMMKAVAVTNDPVRGDEKLTALMLNKTGGMNGVQPMFIPSASADRDNVYINFLNLEKAVWTRPPIILESAAPDKIKSALRENRKMNMLILPADNSIKTVKRFLISMGRWLPDTDPLHITIGSLDASEETIKYMENGYIDAMGTRDIVREAESLVNPLLTAIDERNDYPSFLIHVPGIVLTAKDIDDNLKRVWIKGYTPAVPDEPAEAAEAADTEDTVEKEKPVKEKPVDDGENERGPKNPREKKVKPPKNDDGE